MGSFMKKGKRVYENKIKKDFQENAGNLINETMMHMNHAFSVLSEDPELTEETFDSKLKAITKFPFNDIQINILRKDLMLKYDEKAGANMGKR